MSLSSLTCDVHAQECIARCAGRALAKHSIGRQACPTLPRDNPGKSQPSTLMLLLGFQTQAALHSACGDPGLL